MLREAEIEVPLVAEPKLDEVLALLRNARDLVRQAWGRSRFISPGGEVCSVGAILIADGQAPRTTISGLTLDPNLMSQAARLAVGELCDAIGQPYTLIGLMSFNDGHGKWDVLNMFDCAIDRRKGCSETSRSK